MLQYRVDIQPPEKTRVKRNGQKILEKDVESYAIKEARKRGWTLEKFASPQKRSVPDRIGCTGAGVGFPVGLFFYLELKRPGCIATNSQQQDHKRRREMGHLVFVCDCYEQVDAALDIVDMTLTRGVVMTIPVWLAV